MPVMTIVGDSDEERHNERELVRASMSFTAFRRGILDHHGDFKDLDFITPQWSPRPIDAPDPKVDIAAGTRGCRGWRPKRPTGCTSIRLVSRAIALGMRAECG